MTLRSSVLLSLLVALTWIRAAAAGGHGSLYISTLPPGAAVWMDGRYMGETPLFVDGLDSGRHFVTLIRSGWQPQSAAVDVIIGRVTSVSAVLASNRGVHPQNNRAKGRLQIRDAAGAKIYIDGNLIQPSNDPQLLAAGDHILSVVRGGAKTTGSVRVYPDTTTTISLAPKLGSAQPSNSAQDELAALTDYVPASDFIVNGDTISVHYKGFELECAVGSLNYVLNGKSGTLGVAPAMVGDKPFLPVSLLNRITGKPPM